LEDAAAAAAVLEKNPLCAKYQCRQVKSVACVHNQDARTALPERRAAGAGETSIFEWIGVFSGAVWEVKTSDLGIIRLDP
jgi:hypothetical protein